jgi:MFS family permease
MSHMTSDDLDAAAAAGIVTAEQAAALRAFAAEREKQRAAALGHEERFRFMRGFNDFFFAIGVILLGFGLGFFAGPAFAGNMIAAAILWALAELLVRRMRLVLPGILLACFFVAFVYRAIPIDLSIAGPPPNLQPGIRTGVFEYFFDHRHVAPVTLIVKALVATSAATIYYARFRLPFALLPIAAGLVLAATAAAGLWTDDSIIHPILLLCGLLVFAAAMAFDLSDRERLTRRADCAFWLHLLAAPLIVHSLITLVLTPTIADMTDRMALAIIAVVACIAVVAILIDRRALLVSALAYIGIVVGYALSRSGAATSSANRTFVIFATLLILGALVIALGVGWLPLRRALMRALPAGLANRLPPAVPA